MPLSHLSGYFGTRGRSPNLTSVGEMMSSTGRGPYPIQPLMTIEEINKKRGQMGLALLPTAPTGLPTMPMLGGMDGGGAGNGGGGQIRYGDSRPSFGGLQHQSSFTAKPDGSTVAPLAAAAGNGLGDFYGGQSASGGPPRPMLTSWGDEMPNFAPRKAYGGMLKPGQPFIAGDAQKDGKANPELILPGPNGTHVIPLKGKGKKGRGLPMLAQGTINPDELLAQLDDLKNRAGANQWGARESINNIDDYMANFVPQYNAGQERIAELDAATAQSQANLSNALQPRAGNYSPAFGPMTWTPSPASESRPPVLFDQVGAQGVARPLGTRPSAATLGVHPPVQTGQMPPQMPTPPAAAYQSPMEPSPIGALPQSPVLQAQAVPHGTSEWTPERLREVASAQFRAGRLPETEANIAANKLNEGQSVEEVRQYLSDTYRDEQKRTEAARQKAMNPQGINVGFTARQPLTAFARPTLTPQQIADADYDRYERITRREAMRNPQLAAAMLAGRGAAEQKRLDREARERVVGIQQGGADRRSTAGITAADARAEATNQRLLDDAAVARNFKLSEEGREQAKYAQTLVPPQMSAIPAVGAKGYSDRFAGPKFVGTYPTGEEPELSIKTFPGSNLGVGMIGNKQATGLDPFVVEAEGTQGFPGVPALRSPTLGNFPAIPATPATVPQFKPAPKQATPGRSAVSDPVKVKANAFKQAIAAIEKQIEDITDPHLKVEAQKQKAELLKRQYDDALADLGLEPKPVEKPVPPPIVAPTGTGVAARAKAAAAQLK